MILHTASEVISLAKDIESKSAKFFEDLSSKDEHNHEIFLTYSRENRKNIKLVTANISCKVS